MSIYLLYEYISWRGRTLASTHEMSVAGSCFCSFIHVAHQLHTSVLL
jgi:hypothetical protein